MGLIGFGKGAHRMNKGQAYAIIGQRLSGRLPEDMEEFIDGEARLVQEGILEGKAFVPWFLRRVEVLEVGPGLEVIPLPEGFLMHDVEEGAFVPLDTGEKLEVRPVDMVDGIRHLRGRSEGVPRWFALDGENNLRVFPQPDAPYEIVFSYLSRDANVADLTTTQDNQWLRHGARVLVGELGKKCAGVVRDADAFKMFSDEAAEAWADLEARTLERRLAGQALRF